MRGAHGALRSERVPGGFRSDAPLGEMTAPPDAYQWRSQRARLGFWPLAVRGLLFSVCVIGVLVAVTWATA